MRTFKVTFFDKDMEVFKVETFHNVVNQSLFTQHLAILIDTLELAEVVKVISGDENYSEAVNHFLRYDLADIRK